MLSKTAPNCGHFVALCALFCMLDLKIVYIFSIRYRMAESSITCLANYQLGQARMVTLESLRNQLAEGGSNEALQLFSSLVWTCITFEFEHFTLQQNKNQFVLCWAIEKALCKVEDGQLVLNASMKDVVGRLFQSLVVWMLS